MSAVEASLATSTVRQIALSLAEEYGFRVFPCKPDKTPYTVHGFKDASSNIEQIIEWWEEWPDALIGVAAGRLIVVDIDPEGAGWYSENVKRLACGRVHKTRRGHHLLYRSSADVEIRNSAGQIARGVDVRGHGGYIIWWPAHGCEAIGDLEELSEPPAWLLAAMKSKTNCEENREKPPLGRDRACVGDGERNNFLSKEGYRLRRTGLAVDQIVPVLHALNRARCAPPLDDIEVEKIAAGKEIVEPRSVLTEARPESLTLDEMLARFVHVARGPLVVDLTNTYRRLRGSEFAAAYAHVKVVLEKKAVPATSLWAQSAERMTADALTFHPGEGRFFTERGLRHLNIWVPPEWPTVEPSNAAPFFDHLDYLIPDIKQRADLLDWLAHAVQVPAIRPHFHFLLVAAQEGTGRSWVIEVLRTIWGERHAGETDLHKLLDDSFNSVLSGKILMGVHEVKAPADERYSHRDRLKGLLTDSMLTVNEKHEPRWTERFCARFLMCTNRDDALPLSETDRRVYVVRCNDQPKESAYYTSIYGKISDRTFLAAVWQALRSRDISAFNPGARAPLNEMKVQMIAAGRTDEQQTAAEFLRVCPYAVVAATDLMRVLAPELDDERAAERKGRMNAIAAVLREMGAQTYSKKIKIDKTSTRVWILKGAARWVTATPAALCQEAEKTRRDIEIYHAKPEMVLEHWGSP